MVEPTLIDTGPIVAILDKRDQHHKVCKAHAERLPEVWYTCWPVITEACYLLRKRPNLVKRLIEVIDAGY